MKLRPHHLLCTQGYSGKGYSPEFIENMTAITTLLRADPAITVELVFSTDDICAKCPQRLGENLCSQNERVKGFDQKVIDYFGLTEGKYLYSELIARINSQMTADMMDDICGCCNWYPISACRRKILGEDRV